MDTTAPEGAVAGKIDRGVMVIFNVHDSGIINGSYINSALIRTVFVYDRIMSMLQFIFFNQIFKCFRLHVVGSGHVLHKGFLCFFGKCL